MTKRIVSLALTAAAASAFVLPASPASACSWTFVEDCVHYYMNNPIYCHYTHTVDICVP